MKTLNIAVLSISALLLVSVIGVQAQSFPVGRLFTVDDTGDSVDSTPGDEICADANGRCTLRAAIQEANSCCATNVISFALAPGAVIDLTLGELLITKEVHVVGPGARRLTIQRSAAQGTPNFRIFHIAANAGFDMIIRSFKVRNGNTDGDGGAFYIESGNTIRMTEMAITNNSANRGGGIANSGKLNLTRSLLAANTALTFNGTGGAFMNLDTTSYAVISDSTVAGNSANSAGAIHNNGTLFLVNDTVNLNSANTFGRNIVSAAGGTANVLNTIVSSDNSTAISSLSGAFSSLGNNLITDARNSTGFVNGVNGDQVSSTNSINPLLGALADNGGQTDTLALGAGSPAIDRGNSCVAAGNCPAPVPQRFRLNFDQRTLFRRQTGAAVDVGAFEYQSGGIIGSIGLFALGGRPRVAGSLVILTSVVDNAKRYRTVIPTGSYSLPDLMLGETYVLELRSKRAGLSNISVLETDGIPIFFGAIPGFQWNGLEVVLDK